MFNCRITRDTNVMIFTLNSWLVDISAMVPMNLVPVELLVASATVKHTLTSCASFQSWDISTSAFLVMTHSLSQQIPCCIVIGVFLQQVRDLLPHQFEVLSAWMTCWKFHLNQSPMRCRVLCIKCSIISRHPLQ